MDASDAMQAVRDQMNIAIEDMFAGMRTQAQYHAETATSNARLESLEGKVEQLGQLVDRLELQVQQKDREIEALRKENERLKAGTNPSPRGPSTASASPTRAGTTSSDKTPKQRAFVELASRNKPMDVDLNADTHASSHSHQASSSRTESPKRDKGKGRANEQLESVDPAYNEEDPTTPDGEEPSSSNTPARTRSVSKVLPVTLRVKKGPFSLDALREALGLSDDAIRSIQSLTSIRPGQLPVFLPFVDSDAFVAFMYQPTLIEEMDTDRTYILDWVTADEERRFRQAFPPPLSDGSLPQEYHVFWWLPGKQGWIYIGAHDCFVTESIPLWPWFQARELAYHDLQDKVRRRSGSAAVQDLERRMGNGELRQICIELACDDAMQKTSQEVGRHLMERTRSFGSTNAQSNH